MELQHGGVYLYDPPQIPRSEHDVRFVASGQEQLGERPYIIMSRELVNRGKLTHIGLSSLQVNSSQRSTPRTYSPIALPFAIMYA
jgi:hypothetical protein